MWYNLGPRVYGDNILDKQPNRIYEIQPFSDIILLRNCYVIAIQTDANVLYNIRSLIPQLKQTRPLSGSPNSPLPASSHTTTVAITFPGPQPTFQSHSPRPAHIECHTNKLPVHTLSYPQLTYSVYKSVYKFPCLPHIPLYDFIVLMGDWIHRNEIIKKYSHKHKCTPK